LVFGKEVTLQTFGKDKYGRTMPMYCYRTAPTSITRWLKKAGAGGIGRIRWEIPAREARG